MTSEPRILSSLPQRLGRQDAGLRCHGDPGGTATRLLIAVDAPSVWIAVLRAQLLLRATRVSAADAPPILEERQAREGEAGREKGRAEGKAESATGREARADREGCEGRTRGEETGGEARAAGGAAETRRGGGLRDRSPRRPGRPRSDRGADEGRVCEPRCRVSGR